MPVDLPNAYTLLTMTGIGVAPYSARGLKQSIQPIDSGQLRRTINGTLVDLTAPQFRKFRTTITGSDQLSPALSGIWRGSIVTVECVAEFGYMAGGGSAIRPAVAGSERTEAGVTYYRPILECMVVDYTLDEDEYGRQVGWTLALEEI